MRNISFALTTDQVRNRTKTVTRRLGWKTLKPGTLLQPVVKGQGLKKGERVEKIGGPIQVVSVRRERLDAIEFADVRREGFTRMGTLDFVEFFCRTHRCKPSTVVTRIEFRYVDRVAQKGSHGAEETGAIRDRCGLSQRGKPAHHI